MEKEVTFIVNQLGCSPSLAREILTNKKTKTLAISELNNLIKTIEDYGV